MVATVRNLTSASATSEYFQEDGGYYLKNDDRALQQAKQAEHRNGSAWYGRGARALGLEPGKHVSAGKFEKLLKGHAIGTDVRLGRLRDCCPAHGLRADRRDKLLKWLDTGGQNCTPNNIHE